MQRYSNHHFLLINIITSALLLNEFKPISESLFVVGVFFVSLVLILVKFEFEFVTLSLILFAACKSFVTFQTIQSTKRTKISREIKQPCVRANSGGISDKGAFVGEAKRARPTTESIHHNKQRIKGISPYQ